MKNQLITLLSSLALTAAALAHGDIELGPNGGRILEFSKNETMHGEVTLKDGKFVVPAVTLGEWLIGQFKADAKARAITARTLYDITICSKSKAQEWICECAAEEDRKEKKSPRRPGSNNVTSHENHSIPPRRADRAGAPAHHKRADYSPE